MPSSCGVSEPSDPPLSGGHDADLDEAFAGRCFEAAAKLRPPTTSGTTKMPAGNPPCFGSEDRWKEWLALAWASHERSMSPRHKDGTVRFELPYCTDCNTGHKQRMEAAGRCDPHWLRRQAK